MSGAAPAAPDGRGGPHVFVADLAAPEPSDADRHHLERVLRLRAGEPLTVGDGAGRWVPARYGATLEVAGPVVAVERPSPAVAVAVALVKGTRPELAVQKLTEAGVDEVILFQAARSVVRWDGDRRARHLERLTQVARSAAEQSRRVWLPEVIVVDDLAAVVDRHPAMVRADRGGAPPDLDRPTIAVGPEGGWTDEERELVPDAVALGGPVLRAETAAVAAGVLLGALRSGIVTPGT